MADDHTPLSLLVDSQISVPLPGGGLAEGNGAMDAHRLVGGSTTSSLNEALTVQGMFLDMFLTTADLSIPIPVIGLHHEVDVYLERKLAHNQQLHSIQLLFTPSESNKSLIRPDTPQLPTTVDPFIIQRKLIPIPAPTSAAKKKKKKKPNNQGIFQGDEYVAAVDPIITIEDRISRMKIEIFDEYKLKLDQMDRLVDHIRSVTDQSQDKIQRYEEETRLHYQSSRQQLGLPPMRVLVPIDEAKLKRAHLVSLEELKWQPADQKEDTSLILPPIDLKQSPEFLDYLDQELQDGQLEADMDLFGENTSGKGSSSVARPSNGQEVAANTSFSAKQSAHITRKLMKKLQARLDYLKNPRFDGGSQTQTYIVDPSPVLFTDYFGGQIYKKRFTLTNGSDRSRRFRVILPETPSTYFNVECCDFPDAKTALVSPGLSCTFEVAFYPASLHDYSDEFVLSAESGEVIRIPLFGRRNIPRFDLPGVFDCGHCRAGFSTVRKWTFVNSGGNGDLVLVRPEDVSRAESFLHTAKKATQPLIIGDFEIFPATLSVRKGESVEFTVRYTPEALEKGVYEGLPDTVDLVAYFDNSMQIPLKISGIPQKPQVYVYDLVETDPFGAATHHIFQPTEQITEQIDFGQQNPHGFTRKTLVLKNHSNLPLPYRWIMANGYALKPSTINGGPRDPSEKAFTVFPNRGTLKPLQETSFEIVFAPIFMQKYFSVANILLANASDEFYRAPSKPKTEEYLAATLHLTGECRPYAVEYHPATLLLPDHLYHDSSFQHPLTITNLSAYTATYHCEIEIKDAAILDVRVDHPSGQVREKSSSLLHVHFYGKALGTTSGMVHFHIQNGVSTSFPFSVKVLLPPHIVEFDPPFVDFGLMTPGTPSSKSVPVKNLSDRELTVLFKMMDTSSDEVVTIEPREITLKPHAKKMVHVQYQSDKVQRFRDVLECVCCIVNERQESTMERVAVCDLVAQVQYRKARFLDSKLDMDVCYVGVPKTIAARLKNTTQLPTEYRLMDMEEDQFDVTFHPSSGTLEGGEVADIQVCLLAKSIMRLEDLLLVAHIAGMPQGDGFLGLQLSADVRGFAYQTILSQALKTMTEDAEAGTIEETCIELPSTETATSLDFGEDFPIFSRRTRTFVVQNVSGIRVPFVIRFENYGAPRQEKLASADKSKAGSSSSALVPVDNGIGFQCPSGQIYAGMKTNSRSFNNENERYLVRKHGIAFRAVPEEGYLEPMESRRIQIVAYTNLWGNFEDQMTLVMGDWAQWSLPIRAGVVGSPLRFIGHTLVAEGGGDASVNFGTRLRMRSKDRADFVDVVKSVQIQNLSPKTIRVDWRSFLMQPWNEHQAVRMDINLREWDQSGAKVDLCLRDHSEIEGDSPFRMEPAALDIPANSEQIIDITFHHPQSGMYFGFLLGELSYYVGTARSGKAGDLVPACVMEDVDQTYEFNWERAKQAGPMQLNLRGKIIEPDVVLSSKKPQIRYRCNPKEAESIVTAQGKPAQRWRKSVSLLNPTEMVLQFDIQADVPLEAVVSRTKHKDGFYRLNPNQEIFLDLLMTREQRTVDVATVADDQGQQREQYFLEVLFCNGEVKRIPVSVE